MTETTPPPPVGVWFTIAELARLALPGLPGTTRGIQRWAARAEWQAKTGLWRKRAGTAQSLEYHCRLLPEAALTALSLHAVAGARLSSWDDGAATPVTDGDARLKAKLTVLTAYDAFVAIYADGRSETRGRHRFVELYRAGTVPVAPQVRALVKSISASSLERWSAARTDARLEMLAGRYGNRKGCGLWDTELAAVRDELYRLAARHPHWSVNRCRNQLRVRFGDPVTVTRADGSVVTHRLPTLRSMQLRVRDWAETFVGERSAAEPARVVTLRLVL